MRTARPVLGRSFDRMVPAHERWAEIIESMPCGDGVALGTTAAMMAHVIRDRAVADPYAAIRIVLSFRFGHDADHDAAVDRIGAALHHAAIG